MQVLHRTPRRVQRRLFRWALNKTRRVNYRWLLATGLLVAVPPFVVVWLHEYQAPRNAQFLKEQIVALEDKGNVADAVRLLRLYLGSHPTSLEMKRRLGRLLSQSENPKDLEEARDILWDERSGTDDPELLSLLLRIDLRLGRFSDAMKVAQRLETMPEADSTRMRWISEAYEANGLKSDAVAAIRRAISLDPTSLTAYARYLPLLYQTTFSRSDLQKAIDQMLESSSDRPMAALLAYTILRNEQLPGARDYLSRALEIAPDNVEVLLMAAGDGFANKPREAGQWLERAYRLAPDDDRVLLTYGKWLLWSGQLEKALKLFEAGFRHNDDRQADFAWRAAETLVELRRFDEVAPYFAALPVHPGYQAASRYVRGRSSLLQGKPESAESDFLAGQKLMNNVRKELAVAGDRNELAYKLDLGMAGVKYLHGDIPAAIRWAENAHERLPVEYAPLTALGQMCFDEGDLERSEKFWSMALDCPFVPPGAQMGLARTLLARLWEQPASERDARTILDQIERAKASIPNDPNIPLVEADAYWAVGDLERAGEILAAARQAHPRNEPIAISRIRLSIAAGRFDVALDQIADYEATFGRTFDSVLARAVVSVLTQRFDESLRILEAAESTLPSSTWATLKRLQGQVLWLEGHDEQAGHRFAEACRLDPTDDVAWVFHWIWLNSAGRTDEVDRIIQSSRAQRGNSTPVWRWAEAMRIQQLAPPDARKQITALARDLRRSHPFRWETIHVSGLEHQWEGNSSGAIRSFLRALPRGPAPPQLAADAVQILMDQGRFRDARGVWALVRQQRLPLPQDPPTDDLHEARN